MLKAVDLKSVESNLDNKIKCLIEKCPERERNNFIREMNSFKELFVSYLRSRARKELIDWDKIKPPPAGMVVPYSEIPSCNSDQIKQLAEKLCVLKLNGGLGTTMGCVGPKSLIEVRSDKNFLDLTIEQIKVGIRFHVIIIQLYTKITFLFLLAIIQSLNKTYNVNVPLILMNSFNTHEDTWKVMHKYEDDGVSVRLFNQSRYPRVFKDSLTIVPEDPDFKKDKEAWFE
jgi:UTP--glucose-1-phosphate uridylyltransferase